MIVHKYKRRLLIIGCWLTLRSLGEGGLLGTACHSQQVYFENIFGSAGSDFARAVRQLNNGNIYVGGFSNGGPYGGFDFALSKCDRYGNPIWTKYYGDTLDNHALYMNTCTDGNFILCGETQTDSAGLDILVYKTDTAGNKLWSKQYGTSANESAKYITSTSDGGFILTGFQNDPGGSNDIYVLKTDSAGTTQWEKTFGGTDNEYADMVRETPEGDFIVTADTKSKGVGGYDIEVIKINSSGTLIWDSTYGDTLNNGCQGILITSKNKYLSYGETEIYQFSPFDFLLELIDTDGRSLWKKTFGGVNSDAIFSAVETPDGGFMLTGYSNSYAPGPIDLMIMRTDSLGNLLWAKNYGGGGTDIGYDIIASLDNGYLITGKIFAGTDEFYLLHLDTAGMITAVNTPERSAEVLIYPNPISRGKSAVFSRLPIAIGTAGGHNYDLEIFDVLGVSILKQTINTTHEIIDLDVAPGIYFYRIYSDEKKIGEGKLVVIE